MCTQDADVLQKRFIQQSGSQGVCGTVSDALFTTGDDDHSDHRSQSSPAAGQVGKTAGGVCRSTRRGPVTVLNSRNKSTVHSFINYAVSLF